MNWQDILTILIPILGLMSWMYTRIDKRFDKVDSEIDDVKKGLHSLEMRLTRLEARFDERGYWESRKTGTLDEK